MKLLLALGNPEQRYNGTRHNVGFAVLDAWVTEQGGEFKTKAKFKAELAELTLHGEKVLAAKPTTYYNNVGESFRALSDFYHIAPEDVLVVADELALPFGKLRTRTGGSDAGSNGIKNLIAHGGEATKRLRIGIWSEHSTRIDNVDFVLSKFTTDELQTLEQLEPTIFRIFDEFITENFEVTTHLAE